MLAIGLNQELLRRDGLAREYPREQWLQLTRTRVADHFADTPSGHVLAALREPLFVVAIEKAIAVVAIDV